MPLYLSTRSLNQPTDLVGVLDVFRMAQVRQIALLGPQAWSPEAIALITAGDFDLRAHGAFLPADDPFVPNLAAGDEDFRRRSLRRVEDALAFCAHHGLGRYTLAGGYALEETRDLALPSRSIAPRRALDQLMRSLDRLCSIADSRGLSLGLTNADPRDPHALLTTPGLLVQVLEALQVPFLGVELDLGYRELSKPAGESEQDPWRSLVPRVTGLRLHEATRAGQLHQLPAEDGPTEELLSKHPDWHGLPMVLDVRGVSLDRLLHAQQRLEARFAPRLVGPLPGR